jgi:hypothetical protein
MLAMLSDFSGYACCLCCLSWSAILVIVLSKPSLYDGYAAWLAILSVMHG